MKKELESLAITLLEDALKTIKDRLDAEDKEVEKK